MGCNRCLIPQSYAEAITRTYGANLVSEEGSPRKAFRIGEVTLELTPFKLHHGAPGLRTYQLRAFGEGGIEQCAFRPVLERQAGVDLEKDNLSKAIEAERKHASDKLLDLSLGRNRLGLITSFFEAHPDRITPANQPYLFRAKKEIGVKRKC